MILVSRSQKSPRAQHGSFGSLLSVSQGGNQVVGWLSSYLKVWEEPASKLIQVGGRIPFLVVVGLKSVPFSLLAVSQGLIFAPRGYPHSFSCFP